MHAGARETDGRSHTGETVLDLGVQGIANELLLTVRLLLSRSGAAKTQRLQLCCMLACQLCGKIYKTTCFGVCGSAVGLAAAAATDQCAVHEPDRRAVRSVS